jgi:hypothetical protein
LNYKNCMRGAIIAEESVIALPSDVEERNRNIISHSTTQECFVPKETTAEASSSSSERCPH